ncbi:amino acid ABC transporter permease [Streptomyces albus]|uniref:Amino acid ABC transporter permease n=1 Tax=Streptomyces albus TaxID=1888 RepID=A0A6C1CAL5_9ACTN|nr:MULTISPECIES: amino acid ABC transporter permease [Streptomyces]KPC90231.1 ABC transporter permease [Streptomyces sp. NRRL F-6602]MDI6409735.1 amino acid ABC transporter permease [Streptomyces albus]QID39480.1 amino acid ABC transporter permease [Streptomyces albus]TGG86212.1 amino acid ABC transporter permease [Streptomyces albus]UVN53461.1 amino acid ABC transporter permease [Streptomyces albus]
MVRHGAAHVSRRNRTRAVRTAQYGVLVLLVVAVALAADWSELRRAFFDAEVAREQFPDVVTTALVNTVVYTVLGFVFGLALGLLLALMRLSPVPPYRWLAVAYIEFFRGVPALLVFIALGFGVPLAFQVSINQYVTVMLALGLVGAAYMAETIRAGIQAVPKGQTEAARSLGMSSSRAMVSIVIPQAFRIVLPPLANELILLTKDSSLVYLLGLSMDQYELAKFGRDALNQHRSLTPILIAGLFYLAITLPLGHLVRRLEARAARAR